MTQEAAPEQKHRKPRPKRDRRKDKGLKLVVRLSEPEMEHLRAEAGDVGISTFVRASLFGGGVKNRDVLRKIAALHVLGRRLAGLTDEDAAAHREIISAALGDVRAAIAALSGAIAIDDEPNVPEQ